MRFHLWLIIGILGIGACNGKHPPTAPLIYTMTPNVSTHLGPDLSSDEDTETSNNRPTTGIVLPNLVIHIEGELFVRHEGQANDQRIPLGVGDRVEAETELDQLFVSGGETAIFCGNESLWDKNLRWLAPKDNFAGVPCLAGAPPPPAPDISRLRGEINAAPDDVAPYVLRPRGGWVSEERPLLRWQSPPGIETVTLMLLSDDGIERPPVTVSGSETTYPEEWEPLQAGGASYRLQISDGITSTGFSLLEAETINQLRQQTEVIQVQVETEPGRTLVLAELLLYYGLWSEVVDLLSALPDGARETAVQKQLGQTYLFMGLFDEAHAALSQSLLSAQRANLPEAAANVSYLLGWATCGLGQVSETQTHWNAALQQFQTLDLAKMSEEISKQLSRAADICPLP